MSSFQENIIIDTGNVSNLGIIKRNVLLKPNEEVLEGIENIFNLANDCKNCVTFDKVQFALNETDTKCLLTGQNFFQEFDRSKLKLSVKLFLFPEMFNHGETHLQSITNEAFESICKILNVTYIDNLILSVQTNETDQVIPKLKSVWNSYESLIMKENKKILSLGSSDLDGDQLRELFESSQIKPSSSQINLDSCCDIPADLSSFAKNNSIQLLTHNDPSADFLPLDRLKVVLNNLQANNQSLEEFIPSVVTNVQRRWVARYTLMILGQGVLFSKGYLVSLQLQ